MNNTFLLVNIPFYHSEAAAPPLGLAYLAAALEEEGFNVDLLDAHALGMDGESIVSHVRETSPAAVGFSVMSSMLVSAKEMAAAIRDLDARPLILFGGPHPTLRPEECLGEGGADLCVRGEGERTIVELFGRLQDGPAAWRKIAGLSFLCDGKVEHTGDRELIADLNSIPYPAHHLLPMGRYTTLHTGKKRFCSIMTSRGCIGRCMFCSRCIFGRRMRYRSIDNVIGEMSRLVTTFGIEEISILDDAFTEDRERIMLLCKEIKAREMRFAWRLGNGARVDKVDGELLGMMKEAGCYEVAFGVESGDDEVLRKIGKEVTTRQVREAFRAAQSVGLDTIGFFMIGHPFDTLETMKKTVDFAISLDATYAQFTIATPLPGTALWSWVERQGKSLFGGDVTKLDFLGGTPHFETDAFTKEDARRMYRRAYLRFYLRPSYIWKTIMRIRSLNDLFVLLKGALYLRKA